MTKFFVAAATALALSACSGGSNPFVTDSGDTGTDTGTGCRGRAGRCACCSGDCCGSYGCRRPGRGIGRADLCKSTGETDRLQ